MSRQAEASEDTVLAWLFNEGDWEWPICEEVLKTVIDDVRFFWDPKEFLECITVLSDYRVFVVLGQDRTAMVGELLPSDWIVCIYLQGSDERHVMNVETRIRGESLDASELFLRLSQDINVFKRTPLHLIFCLPSEERSTQSVQQQEVRFVWSSALLETILKFPRPTSFEETYKDVIDESRLCYRGNEKELKRIDDFSHTYTPDKAITWYTQDSFLYRVLNRAMRTQNMVVIYKYRFILQDIHHQIDELFKIQQSTLIKGRVQHALRRYRL